MSASLALSSLKTYRSVFLQCSHNARLIHVCILWIEFKLIEWREESWVDSLISSIAGYEGSSPPLPRWIPLQESFLSFHSINLPIQHQLKKREELTLFWFIKERMNVEWKVGWWNGEWGGKHITFYPVIKRKLVFFYGGSHSQLISSTHFIPQNKKINLLFLLHSIQLIY